MTDTGTRTLNEASFNAADNNVLRETHVRHQYAELHPVSRGHLQCCVKNYVCEAFVNLIIYV